MHVPAPPREGAQEGSDVPVEAEQRKGEVYEEHEADHATCLRQPTRRGVGAQPLWPPELEAKLGGLAEEVDEKQVVEDGLQQAEPVGRRRGADVQPAARREPLEHALWLRRRSRKGRFIAGDGCLVRGRIHQHRRPRPLDDGRW